MGYVVIENATGAYESFPLSKNSKEISKNTLWNFYLINTPAKPESKLSLEKNSQLDHIEANSDFSYEPNTQAMKVIGTNQSESDLTYDVEFNLVCTQGPAENSAFYDSDKKLYTVNLSNTSSCTQLFVPPKITNHQFLQAGTFAFLDHMGWPKYIVGAVLCVVLLYITFFGSVYFKVNLWILGFLTGWISTYIVLSLILNTETTWAIWTLYIIAIFGGIGVAVMFACMEKIAIYGGGAFLGVCVGFQLYALVIYKADVYIGEPVMYYVTVIVLGLLFLGLTYWLHDFIWICATSVGGAYLFVKCSGKMMGGYPDELDVATEISKGELNGMPWTHWAYLACSVVLAILGIIFQWIQKKRRLAKSGGDEFSGHQNWGHDYRGAYNSNGSNNDGLYNEIV